MPRMMASILVAGLACLGVATDASALRIDPDPVSFMFDPDDAGSILSSVDGSTITFQIQMDSSTLKRLSVMVVGVDGSVREPVDAGTVVGSGDAAVQSIINPNGEVEFKFQALKAPDVSDLFSVAYADLDVGDVIIFEVDRKEGRQLDAAIVPEPSTLVLLALGVGGLAWFGRRRTSAGSPLNPGP
ncbi:MAG: PEP-CTERM sorting domain-containing protein [Deltaproteobacteria bacterium]|nr:MAG: PEP-CTERM sorting domain-containing protein [Deltaproteobacteria bacterium]